VKYRLTLGCLFVLSAVVFANEKPKAALLTPKEIAEGWILLFDGETAFGWKIVGDSKVENGELVLGGSKATTAECTTTFGEYRLHIDKVNGTITLPGNRRFETGPVDVVAKSSDSGAGKPIIISVAAGQVARLTGIKLQPQDLQSLFNGKDLTGWKRFDANPMRAKSEFSVTPEGCIHLKNGPGDLQTEKQFADFVLQIECFTNGAHLNSGVFFRCIPGQYQQGYESQIHNYFAAEPVRDYVIEDYDPNTNELKNKTKVKFTAYDYGTGAIYRRIPARGPAAKDREWFTMTIAAKGKHLATWVNGVQQTDWIDNRPVKDNARNGCKLEKGGISLQGHDKTTDLLFRNIRIEELTSMK
jgi:hypothetical protein